MTLPDGSPPDSPSDLPPDGSPTGEDKFVGAYRPPGYVELKAGRGTLLCGLAAVSLVVGIGGTFSCFICISPVAMALSIAVSAMAKSDLAAMKSGKMHRVDRRATVVALILAIVALLTMLVLVAIMVSSFVYANFFDPTRSL